MSCHEVIRRTPFVDFLCDKFNSVIHCSYEKKTINPGKVRLKKDYDIATWKFSQINLDLVCLLKE